MYIGIIIVNYKYSYRHVTKNVLNLKKKNVLSVNIFQRRGGETYIIYRALCIRHHSLKKCVRTIHPKYEGAYIGS